MADSEKQVSSSDTEKETTTPMNAASNPKASAAELDLEAARSSVVDTHQTPKDPNLVDWDGPEDPANPKYWPNKEKWTVTILVSCFVFISPVSSSMVAPALGKVGEDLKMRSDLEVEMALSIFVLGYAVGPLLFGPISEIYGRSRVVQLSNLFYLAWNLGCGFAQNRAEFFVFRFLAGIGGSAPLAIGGGVIRSVIITHRWSEVHPV